MTSMLPQTMVQLSMIGGILPHELIMTLYEFKAHIRTLGDFTNIHAENLYARYLAGALNLDQIAVNAPPKVIKSKVEPLPVVEPVQQEPAHNLYIKLPPKKMRADTRARLDRQARQEDNIILMVLEHDSISLRGLMDELGYRAAIASGALRRLQLSGVLLSKRNGKSLAHYYYLAPAEEVCSA